MLDDRIGDIPAKSSLLLSTLPGIDPTPFGLTIVNNALKSKNFAVYIVNNKPVHALIREAVSAGLELANRSKRFYAIDAFSGYIGMASHEKYVINNPLDVREIIYTAGQAIEKSKARNPLVVVDSISSYIDVGGKPENILKLITAIRARATVLGLFSEWKYSIKTIRKIKQEFDAIFTVKPIEELAIVRLFLYPEKVSWKKRLEKKIAVPVKVMRGGGVMVYFPKILVTGPYQAGKTSLVRALSTTSISAEHLGTTVALDHGYLNYKGYAADIYGTPGQEIFDPLLEYIAENAVAVILVIDSTMPNTFARAKQMLSKTKSYGLPIVVAANKQDLPNALPISKIRTILGLGKDISICPTVAHAKKGIHALLNELISKLAG